MQLLRQTIKRLFPRIVYRNQLSDRSRQALITKVDTVEDKVYPLSAAGYDVFTYHGEDGIISYLLRYLQPVKPVFVDIGAGDCIKSNCAMLATHFGWTGLFLDNNESQLAVGKSFYKQKIRNGVAIKIRKEKATPGNINDVIEKEGIAGNIGLLSIDIDGNDYWIWQAIDVIRPAIVVVEAKVEFGFRDVVVPYGEENHHSVDGQFNGASVEAFRKLGETKGYKLVGANYYGYNLFFVKEDAPLNAVTTAEVLNQPETKDSFYPESFFASHTFAAV